MAKVDEETPTAEQQEESMAGCGVCCPPDADILGIKKYNYSWLCLPSLPCLGGAKPPMFLSKDEKLPLLLALIMGLQHALAMVAGIATSGGKLIANDACFAWQKDEDMCDRQSYLISAAWITSGVLTIIQVFRAKLFGGYYLGTGLVSTMGTSFTFLPIAREMVVGAIKEAKAKGEDPTGAGVEGYGKFLGTCMVASLLEMGLAMLPSKIRKKIFPPVVTGVAVFLIGASLISAGVKYLGGGVFCAENDMSRSATFGGPQLCEGNGDVILPYGSPQYVFLGLSVIIMAVLLQIVGSPFLKSTALFWGLLFGMMVAGVSSYVAVEGDKAWEMQDDGKYKVVTATPGHAYGFFNTAIIDKAPAVTFLWAETFPIGFAPEYLLPILIAYFVSNAETIGDVASSCDASEIPGEGP
jgi:NCS2 family nucleobase:cation symporter-2